MAFLVKTISSARRALMKSATLARAPSKASVASAARRYALRLIGAYEVSMNAVIASMTACGFCDELAESR